MGTFGGDDDDDDDDDKLKSSKTDSIYDFDHSDTETQDFDSQVSPSALHGIDYNGDNYDELQFLQSTVPFDDVVPFEDFDTQVVNAGGETQVLDFGGETQAVDNVDCVEDICTELFDDCNTEVVVDTDDEGSERTEVLHDTEELSDVDSVKRVYGQPVDQENVLHTSLPKQGGGESKASQHNIGDSSKFVEESDQKHSLEECDDRIKDSGNENNCTVGKSAVRKLFMDNTVTEIGLENNVSNTDKDEELPQLELAGLSYVDSQEPGEASQANALDFVDRFLNVNLTDLCQDVEIKKSTGEKSKLVSGAKGTQSLAKSSNRLCSVAEGTMFDWDDNREDDGGGEFFRKKKEEFFDKGPKGRKSLIHSKTFWAVKRTRDEKEQQGTRDRATGLVNSDSKSLGPKPKGKDESMKKTGRKVGKNLIKDLDQQFDVGHRDGMVEAGTEKNNPEMLNVGLDTQMAAEAMEALCFGADGTDHDPSDAKQDPETCHTSSAKGKYIKRSQKRPLIPSNSGVITRQSKQTKKAAPRLNRLRTELTEQGREEKALKDDQRAVKKCRVEEKLDTCYTPVACRTRNRRVNQSQSDAKADTDFRVGMDKLAGIVVPKRKRGRIEKKLLPKGKCTKNNVKQSNDLKNAKLTPAEQSDLKLSGISTVKRKTRASVVASRRGVRTTSVSACTTPVHSVTPLNEASPVCMGDEYHKQSCRKNLSRSSLKKEISRLTADGPQPTSTFKDSRKRRDLSMVQILFSQHLDGDIIKQQEKVLDRLGASIASSMLDATHFIADKFVRTRNMLEAIAFGKPVVTHLWLESCGQASCLIDERNYILRDAKKEKEFGFSLPVSLARAAQHPLLQGQKVLITHNTKPSKEILTSLVKAVHGVAVERVGRSKYDRIPGDLLVLSCEEDYAVCVPFLEKGAAVYSSELLLNGIVTQKLEFERHRLFVDHVRRTRSTAWARKDDDQYIPVTKCK